jgi:hypothetical protein
LSCSWHQGSSSSVYGFPSGRDVQRREEKRENSIEESAGKEVKIRELHFNANKQGSFPLLKVKSNLLLLLLLLPGQSQ